MDSPKIKIDASGKKKLRLVIDYQKLNEKTIEDKYPLPRVEEILDNLGRCVYFSTLDFAQLFDQIAMSPESVEKTAFSVYIGHYEYTRMPFGLRNALKIFKFLKLILLCIHGDVVLLSRSPHEHIVHLVKIFNKNLI